MKGHKKNNIWINAWDKEAKQIASAIRELSNNMDEEAYEKLDAYVEKKINEISDFAFTMKKMKSQMISKKEIITSIFLPIQLGIWAFGQMMIKTVPVTCCIMMAFAILFALIIDKCNKLVFNLECNYENADKAVSELIKMRETLYGLRQGENG